MTRQEALFARAEVKVQEARTATLAELSGALAAEHGRLVRRARRFYALALLCAAGGLILLGAGSGTAFAWPFALASVLMMCGWCGSRRWRETLAALGPRIAGADSLHDISPLLEIGRRLELAPIHAGVGPDGTRHWPATDRTRAVALALGRLLPRLDDAEAAALTLEQRRWLERCLLRAGGRVDPIFGADFLVGTLLTLGTARDPSALAAARTLRHHRDPRVRAAASEYLRALGSNC